VGGDSSLFNSLVRFDCWSRFPGCVGIVAMGCCNSTAAAYDPVAKTQQPYLEQVDGVVWSENVREFTRGKRNVVSWLPAPTTTAPSPLSGEGGEGDAATAVSAEPVKYKGLVLVSHGLHEHANRHFPIARVLARAGYAVYGIDHVCHGLSEGRKCYISDWNVLTDDFVEFAKAIQAEVPNVPTLIMAHSMGTMVTFTAAPRIEGVKGIVFSATPLFVGPSAGSPFGCKCLHPLTQTSCIEPLASTLASTDPAGPCAPIESVAITSDPQKLAIHDADERMYHKEIMNITAYELTKLTKVIKGSVAQFDLPFFALHGSDDQIALPKGSQFLYDNTGTPADKKKLQFFAGLRHEVFHEKEPDCDVVMQQVLDYLNTVIASDETQVGVVDESHLNITV
jgi:acylglycerol lipase